MSLVEKYVESLSALSGDDFQSEVCARLHGMILSFQTVPAKPHGDAGLDAFSHGGERGYCCYGPQQNAFRTNKQLEKAIVDKFKADLRRLLELEAKGKGLVHVDSPEMSTILPQGRKIQHIELIVNWFESHRVLSPILSAFDEYKANSKCRYVDPSATAIVVGPKNLADLYVVDEITILRVGQRVFINAVKTSAQSVTITHTKDFDAKIAILRQIKPNNLDAIDALAGQFREKWRMAIAFDNELDATAPSLHRELEECRGRILAQVAELMSIADEPWTQLPNAGSVAREVLGKTFGQRFGDLTDDVASGEIARLIGDCPIGWKAPTNTHV